MTLFVSVYYLDNKKYIFTALLVMLVVAAIIVIGVYAATDKRANPDT